MKPLNPIEGLYAVQVPGWLNIENFKIRRKFYVFYIDFFNSIGFKVLEIDTGIKYVKGGKIEILGTASESEISFDANSIVEKFSGSNKYFRNYLSYSVCYEYASNSFRSLLHANGLPTDNNERYLILKETK